MSGSVNSSIDNSSDQAYSWHKKTWQQFTQARSQDHLPHAILLSGEKGIAKLSLARRMAKALICINNESGEGDACNECQSCKTYESEANPDFTQISLLEDKQQINVDQIRALSEFLTYSRSYNTNRVVIINPVERMNVNAANSLLKSLEEPSANTVIILVTAKISQLLPTIKSRCQLFNVSSPSKDQALDWLKQQDQTLDAEAILEITGNKPLKALTISQEDIESRNQFFQELSTVINQQITVSEMAKKWEKYDLETLLNWQILLIQKAIKHSVTISATTEKPSKSNHPLTKHLSAEDHWQLYQNLIKQKQYIHTSVNSLMLVENMIILWL